jgi:hypothetical protein
MTGPHRDDFDYQGVDNLVAELAEKGVTGGVVFAGDVPDRDVPPEIRAAQEKILRLTDECAKKGMCVKCGAKRGDWHTASTAKLIEEGWLLYIGKTDRGTLMYGVCPKCKPSAGETIAYLVTREMW